MRESDFINNTLKSISEKFPKSNYVYEFAFETHIIQVYGILKKEEKEFLTFASNSVGEFMKGSFDNFILLSHEAPVVEQQKPTKFSLQASSVEVTTHSSSNDTPSSDSIPFAA